MLRLEPEFQPPADYKPFKFKHKMYIPQINGVTREEFIGMIMG